MFELAVSHSIYDGAFFLLR